MICMLKLIVEEEWRYFKRSWYVDVNACVFNPQSAGSWRIHYYHLAADDSRDDGNFAGTSSNVSVRCWEIFAKGPMFFVPVSIRFQWRNLIYDNWYSLRLNHNLIVYLIQRIILFFIFSILKYYVFYLIAQFIYKFFRRFKWRLDLFLDKTQCSNFAVTFLLKFYIL